MMVKKKNKKKQLKPSLRGYGEQVECLSALW